MSTTIRSELSLKNKYWIERHRYYELKHFCLQYNIWKRLHNEISFIINQPINQVVSESSFTPDMVPQCVEKRLYYSERMKMIEEVAYATDSQLGSYILKGVTSGMSYDAMNTREHIPCCKDKYYELYRKFFWILDKERA